MSDNQNQGPGGQPPAPEKSVAHDATAREPGGAASVEEQVPREPVGAARWIPTPDSSPALDSEPVEPASFPRGFWAGVDYMLHHRGNILESLRRDTGLWRLSLVFLLISLVLAAVYGAVMGATNYLQGAPMPTEHKLLMIVITAIKVPVLFLLTLLIILPPVYVSNTFVGSRMSFRQMLTMLLGSTAVTITVLASMASVAFFFSITSRNYDFLKLLHVCFFAYAGLAGLTYLNKCIEELSIRALARVPTRIFLLWLLLYMFVGTQLAWVLRPFVASPNETFQVFRPRTGSFYESVAFSLGKMVREREGALRR